jgi:hypothetical protein
MTTATLQKLVRDPRSGEVYLPSEQVEILGVMQNLDRTLLRVKWRGGGDCIVFPDDIQDQHGRSYESPQRRRKTQTEAYVLRAPGRNEYPAKFYGVGVGFVLATCGRGAASADRFRVGQIGARSYVPREDIGPGTA